MLGVVRICSVSARRIALSRRRIQAPFSKTQLNAVVGERTAGPSKILRASFHSFYNLQQGANAAAQNDAEVEDAVDETPITRFKELETRGIVHKNIISTITGQMRMKDMTEVQTRTINEALSGVDIIAQAKTGTGKTIAFLLPIIQRILRDDPQLAQFQRRRYSPNDTRALIVSPTRELAEQIAEEARKLVQNTDIRVQTAVGGTRKREALFQMQRQGCHILVGTPGRLADILEDPESGADLPKLSTLVYDEADRLLDTGFEAELDIIKNNTPREENLSLQTLMFSATVPKEVVHLVRSTLRKGFRFVKCVRDDEQATHERVPQKAVVTHGMENMMPALYELCHREIQNSRRPGQRPFKAIVFFNMGQEVTVAREVFSNLGGYRDHPLRPARILHISSKLTQAQRTYTTDTFRKAESAILLSSDVTARGMDFPDVTHVIQFGLPLARDSYVHRLGRTARAGKEGQGFLIVDQMHAFDLGVTFREFPIEKDDSLSTAAIDQSTNTNIPEETARYFQDILKAYSRVSPGELSELYRKFLGVNKSVPKSKMVNIVNDLTKYGWGMEQPPAVSGPWAAKSGYGSSPGLNLMDDRYMGRGFLDRNDPFASDRRRGASSRGHEGDAFDQMGYSSNRGTRRSSGFGSAQSSGMGRRY